MKGVKWLGRQNCVEYDKLAEAQLGELINEWDTHKALLPVDDAEPWRGKERLFLALTLAKIDQAIQKA